MFKKKNDPERLVLVTDVRSSYTTLARSSIPNQEALQIDGTSGIQHCHDNSHAQEDRERERKVARRRLYVATVICLVFMICEILGGYFAGSLAVMTDAAHLLVDLVSFIISLLSLWLSSRPATHKLSYGWHRAEILGALLSVFTIWLVTGVLVYLAVKRIVDDDYTIEGTIMLITSGCAVLANVIMALTLHQSGHGHSHGGLSSHGHSHGGQRSNGQVHSHGGQRSNGQVHSHGGQHSNGQVHSHGGQRSNGQVHSHGGQRSNGQVHSYGGLSSQGHGHSHMSGNEHNQALNHSNPDHADTEQNSVDHGGRAQQNNTSVRAAFVHVLGDLLQSVSVLISAIIIYFKPEYKMADPICTFLFSIFVLCTTITILRDILVVLMEGAPVGVKYGEVRDSLLAVKGVKEVHNLHIWALTMNQTVLTAHVAIDETVDGQTVLREMTQTCFSSYNCHAVTIQMERQADLKPGCTLCEEPKL